MGKVKVDFQLLLLTAFFCLFMLGAFFAGKASCQSMVADYPRYGTEVKPSPKIAIMAGTIFGLNMTHYNKHSVPTSGSGLNPGVNAIFHSLNPGGFFIGLRGGYTNTSVLLPDYTSLSRSAWFGMVDVGVTTGDYLSGGASVGYHSSDIGFRSSTTIRLFGQFKYPIERTELIWFNLHSDFGVMFTDMYTETRRRPLGASLSAGIIFNLL